MPAIKFTVNLAGTVALVSGNDYACCMKCLSPERLVFLLLATLSFSLHAGFYKGVDENGNVVYSDQPFNNAEKIKAPSISVMDAPKVKPKEEKQADNKKEEADGKATRYSRVSIASPKHNETLWNNKALSVSVSISPALNSRGGDYLSLLMDGKTVIKRSTSMQLQLGTLDRGAHKLQVLVRNKQGKVVKRSKPVTVHIKHSVIRKQPRGG